MSEIFISYARSTEAEALRVAEALRALGYGVWRDDELPAHRAYAEVIEERLRAARAVVVLWSAEAVKSQWVRAEADVARGAGTLVQLSLDGVAPPLPFNQIQVADLRGWAGDPAHPGWRKAQASVAELVRQDAGAKAAPAPSSMLPDPPLPSKPSIAVLPFANLSHDPEQDYLAEGMVEEIVSALSRYRSLFVIGAGSGLSFKDQSVSPQEAGRRMGVRYILDGSVRRSGDRVRIAVKLTDATDGAQVWSHRFDDTLEDVFALQDKVAMSVAGVIEPTVQAAEGRRTAARPTSDMTSYELYLRSWKLAWNFDRSDLFEAIALLSRAIELDPNHARALATLAAAHGQVFALLRVEDVEPHRRLGLDLIHRALKLAPDDPEVQAWGGFVLYVMRDDLQAAQALVDQALALNPSLAFAWMAGGFLRTYHGQGEAAAQSFETALRLDPLSGLRHWALTGLGTSRLMQGRLEEAVSLFRESVQLCISSPLNYVFMAAALGHLGRIDEAREALDQFEAFTGVTAEQWVRWQVISDMVLAGITAARGEGGV